MASSSVTLHAHVTEKPRLTKISNWTCELCTFKNSVVQLICGMCGVTRCNVPDIEILMEKRVKSKDGTTQQEILKRGQIVTRSILRELKQLTLDKDSESKTTTTIGTTTTTGLSNVLKPKPLPRKILPSKSSVHIGNTSNSHTSNIILRPNSDKTMLSESRVDTQRNWTCETCTLRNSLLSLSCDACGVRKPQNNSMKTFRRMSNDPRAPIRKALKETYHEILQVCTEVGEKFVDDSFPPTMKSLYVNGKFSTTSKRAHDENSGQGLATKWCRPSEIYDIDSNARNNRRDTTFEWVVTRNPVPSDICQGRLGNCWFMGALALIAERQDLLDNIIHTKEVNLAGVYIIRLCKDGRWTDVIVDDLFPCDNHNRLIYSRGKRKQLWVPLIEKAMAKLHGCYEALVGGYISESLMTLTGFPCEKIDLLTPFLDEDIIWATLVSSCTADFLIGTATIVCKSHEEQEECKLKGVVPNHAYSILTANDETGERLLQLRNPWGYLCWKGDWSDKSTLWTSKSKLILNPTRSKEGIFWIGLKDFLKFYRSVEICKIRKNWDFNSFQGILVPYADVNHPCYKLCITEATEIDMSIHQNSGREMKHIDANWTPGDISLMLFKTSNSSHLTDNFLKDVTVVQHTPRDGKRLSNINCILDSGTYFVIPVSFGHWTERDIEETFPAFELLIYSSRKIGCSHMDTSTSPYLLADAIIQTTIKVETKVHLNNHGIKDIEIYHTAYCQDTFGKGLLYVVENRHDKKWFSMETDLSTSKNMKSTRKLKTWDCIPPRSRQLVNVLTIQNETESSTLGFCFKPTNHSNKPGLSLFGLGHTGNHFPSLSSRNYGLHAPRPI